MTMVVMTTIAPGNVYISNALIRNPWNDHIDNCYKNDYNRNVIDIIQ